MSNPTHIYVVMELGYEYTGDVFTLPNTQQDVGYPILSFSNKEAATIACKRLDHLARRTRPLLEYTLREYSYSFTDIVVAGTQKRLDSFCVEHEIPLIEYWGTVSINDFTNLSEAEKDELAGFFEINFYEVVEVPLHQEGPPHQGRNLKEAVDNEFQRFKDIEL